MVEDDEKVSLPSSSKSSILLMSFPSWRMLLFPLFDLYLFKIYQRLQGTLEIPRHKSSSSSFYITIIQL